MPKYSVRCQDCSLEGEVRLTYGEHEELRSGEKAVECDCGGKAILYFNPGAVTFVMKDGPSGGWVSKALREHKYRKERGKVMARRERDHVFKSKLVPNYNGMETGTWRDAQEEARRDKGELAAKTYSPLVKKESKR